jgi:catechol 2,3-dioxygenase-like lactoylglutathione lyase family enzyme
VTDRSFRVLGLDHVQITTPDEFEDDVVAWYRDVLGLTEITKPEGTRSGGAWFQAGWAELHVSIDQHNPPKAAHFGLVVDAFEGAIERLREAGCHIEQAMAIPGRERFYTRDPAGNRVEIGHLNEQGGT